MNYIQLMEDYIGQTPWYDTGAGRQFLLEEARKLGTVTPETLRQTASRLGDRLPIVPDYADAWNDFVRKHPEFTGAGCAGNRLLAFEMLNTFEPPSVEAFEAIADRQPCPFAVSHAATNAWQEENERQSLISEITQGKSNYPIYSPLHATVKWVSANDLHEQPTEELRLIAKAVEKTRNKMNQSREDQRAELQSHTVANDVMPEVFLENPETPGKEYTARDLKHLSKDGYRKLLFFPGGQARPGVADRITKILKGLA